MSRIALVGAIAAITVVTLADRDDALAEEADETSSLVYTEQGWSPSERRSWYAATQGSRLMPTSWFRALEVPNGEGAFLDPENMRRFRFIYDEGNPENPFPIGFAEDRGTDGNLVQTALRWFDGQGYRESWIGMNCAACHTAELTFSGERIRVDGGPSIIDFQTFDEEVAAALRETHDDEAKFARFANRVLESPGSEDLQKLRDALASLVEWRETVIAANETDLRYGYSRLDAFGHIFNQVALFANAENPSLQAADAPVSFPFLWNTPQHDIVQWNGIAANGPTQLGIDFGALGRNSGEVIGVFGEVNVGMRSGANFPSALGVGPRASSSVFIGNLVALEEQVARLQSPRWPVNILGALDGESVARGRTLFEQECSSCHEHLASDDLESPVIARMSLFMPMPGEEAEDFTAPGTDPAMACRAFERTTAAGFYGDTLSVEENEEVPLSELLATMVKSALVDQAGEIVTLVGRRAIFGRQGLVVHNPGEYDDQPVDVEGLSLSGETTSRAAALAVQGAFLTPETNDARQAATRDWGQFADCMTSSPSPLKAYKARPLNGIWATAPYLHNGSVPNLYELLLPPAARASRFFTGTREFDPELVGYVVEPGDENRFEFRVFNDDGSVRWGNYNGGHDYGNANFSHQDRMDLVEYMKSL